MLTLGKRLGNAICQDLRRLQDDVAPAPFEEMEAILKGELGEGVDSSEVAS